MLASEVLQDKPRLRDFYRGDTVLYNLEVQTDNGVPVDLQGQTAWLSLKKKASTYPELQIKYTFPVDNASYELGKALIYIPSSLTDDLDTGVYSYDIQLVLTVGSETAKITLIEDRVRVMTDITRR